ARRASGAAGSCRAPPAGAQVVGCTGSVRVRHADRPGLRPADLPLRGTLGPPDPAVAAERLPARVRPPGPVLRLTTTPRALSRAAPSGFSLAATAEPPCRRRARCHPTRLAPLAAPRRTRCSRREIEPRASTDAH